MFRVINHIKNVTRHRDVAITSRGNESIQRAFEIVKKNSFRNKLLIPDQGGWLTYRDFAVKMGFDVVELKTDKGVVILSELKKHVNDSSCFIFNVFAGYYAEQPIKEIFNECKKAKCICIADVTGAFSDPVLCNGANADIFVGSFGKWKIVNYGKYGFISSSLYDVGESVKFEDDLYQKVIEAPKRLKLLLEKASKVKEDLKQFDIFHKDKRGINVIVGYDEKVIDYCKYNKYEYVICPKNIKVLEHAISIELKRE